MKQPYLFNPVPDNCSLGPKSDYSDYKTYLQSPDWKEKRKKAFKLLGRKCERCPNTTRLQVHHLNYENLYNETVSDIEIVCESCHPIADTQRANQKGYQTWLRNRYGDDAHYYDDENSYETFIDYKYRDTY